MNNIDWWEGGLQFTDIGNKNVGDPDLTPRMKYIMVRLEGWDRTTVQDKWQNTG